MNEVETGDPADGGLRAAVRAQLGLGRLLPLGGPEDGAWLAERAAVRVLGEAAREPAGIRVTRLRIGPAGGEPEEGEGPAVVTPPPSALPPGPLRVAAAFAASAVRPIPSSAQLLRELLTETAGRRLGLRVVAVDLHVTGLITESAGGRRPGPEPQAEAAEAEPGEAEPGEAGAGKAAAAETGAEEARGEAAGDAEARVAAAVRAVPGVLGLTTALAVPGRAVRVRDGEAHLQVRLRAPGPEGPRTLDVARAVRDAAARAAGTDRVAVLITDLV
ncbi:hypothetical protein [Streptomyces sp. YIM 98790]|uniref:hypothetical protein n=1 Tax=Streptomyces sp. YIM 98790 TaxID=2689077 RepID=UPI00140BE872|nr:hypothetical protein [Streptomyces sp. YIM 98790]